jgi:hypothetical protein
MNAKEKAKELINKFIPHTRVFHQELGWEDYLDSAKQCALICCDEVLGYMGADRGYEFWTEVKQEIKNL